MQKGKNLDSILHHLTNDDINDTDAKTLLLRLQRIADTGLPQGVSRPMPNALTVDEGAVQQHQQSRKIIERTLLLLERLEVSPLEHKVSELQLLHSITQQRFHLISPRSLVRDHKANNSLPLHLCSPHGVKYPQVQHKIEVMADAGAWLLCKDPFCLNGQYYYINKNTKSVQVGEPIDFVMKKNRQFLRQEKWYVCLSFCLIMFILFCRVSCCVKNRLTCVSTCYVLSVKPTGMIMN